MNKHYTRRDDMFVRVQTFGNNNAADFAAGSIAAQKFAVVSTVIKGLTSAGVGQKPGRDTSKAVLLGDIQIDLQNITRTASAIAQTEPGFADAFRSPGEHTPAAVLRTADKFIAQLLPQAGDSADVLAAKTALVAKFVAHEMKPDFATTLQSDYTDYTSERDLHETKRQIGVGDTTIIEQLIAQGMEAVNTLTAIMHNKYASQPDKLAAWLTASHVERATRTDTTTTTTTTAAPQTEAKK